MRRLKEVIRVLSRKVLSTRTLPATNLLISINIVAYILQSLYPSVTTYGVFHSNIPYTYLTSLFLHASLSHLTGNLLFLCFISHVIERNYGSLFTFLAYLFTGACGSLLFALFLPQHLALGASGSICGLMMLWVFHTVLNQQYLLALAALFYIVMQGIFSGTSLILGGGIGYLAHYGSAMAAILLLPQLFIKRKKPKC